jgi:hypothetical protein
MPGSAPRWRGSASSCSSDKREAANKALMNQVRFKAQSGSRLWAMVKTVWKCGQGSSRAISESIHALRAASAQRGQERWRQAWNWTLEKSPPKQAKVCEPMASV